MSDRLEEFRARAHDFTHDGQRFFNTAQPVFTASAPGRLDLMGGIADYSGSLVLEMPIAEATYVALQRDTEPMLRIVSERAGQPHLFEMPLTPFGSVEEPISYAAAVELFHREPASSWAAYVAGVFLVLMKERGRAFDDGARIYIKSDVPEGKGVSSSAALEVAAMTAIADAFGIDLGPTELAILCQMVENRVAGAPCGIMDQMTVVHGRPNQLLKLRCQPAEIEGYVDLPPELAVWGIDSGVRHAVSGADYGSVRVGAFMGLKILQTLEPDNAWNGYLANIPPSLFEQHYRQRLPVALSGADFLDRYGALPDEVTVVDPSKRYAVQQPTAHPIYENFRVETFARLLAGDPMVEGPLLGELMRQSHASYSACGLGSDATDLLVDLVRHSGSGLYGAKITGGGSGGTVAVMGAATAEGDIAQVVAQFERQTGHTPYLFRMSAFS